MLFRGMRMGQNSKMEEDFDRELKVLVIGNGGVGKTSMIRRFAKGIFTDEYKKTIGVDFLEKALFVDALGEEVRFMLWDTGERGSRMSAWRRDMPLPRSWAGGVRRDHPDLLQGRRGSRDRVFHDRQGLFRRRSDVEEQDRAGVRGHCSGLGTEQG